MDAKSFLRRQLLQKDRIFFSAINFSRALKLRESKRNYSWKANKYKIYPSSLKSLSMCPKRFIEEDVHKAPGFELPTVYKLELGKIVHEMLQDEAIDFNPETLIPVLEDMAAEQLKLLDTYLRKMYKREALTCKALLYERPRDLGPELEAKYKGSYPEIPGYDEATGVSFRTDLVLNIDDYPAVLDLKTTSVEKEQWETQRLELPSDDHKLQVRIYRHFMNKHKYYDKPIKKVGLGYINLLIPAGHEDSEHEAYIDLGEGPDEEVELLMSHLALHRDKYLESEGKEQIECSYPKCFKHSKEVVTIDG